MAFLDTVEEKADKKERHEIYCKPSTWREFNIIRAELVKTQGGCLEYLVNLYRHRDDSISIAGLPK